MAETVDGIVCELRAPKPTAHALNVAQSLVELATHYEGTGATAADIASGFRMAVDRVAAWAVHRDYWRLRHDLDAADDLAA